MFDYDVLVVHFFKSHYYHAPNQNIYSIIQMKMDNQLIDKKFNYSCHPNTKPKTNSIPNLIPLPTINYYILFIKTYVDYNYYKDKTI